MTLLEELTITKDTNFNIFNDWLHVDFTKFIEDEPNAPGALDYVKTILGVLQSVFATREDLDRVTITPDSKVTLNHIPPSGGFGATRVFILDNRMYDTEEYRADEDDLVEVINEIIIPVLQHNQDENAIEVELRDKAERRFTAAPQ